MECCLGLTGKDFHSLKVAGYKLMAVFPKDMMVPYYLLMAMTSDKASLSEAEVLAEAQVHFHPGNFELVRAWSGIAGAKYYATLKKEDLLEAIRRTRHVIDIAPTDLPKAETESIARYLRLAESIRVSKGW